MIVSLFTEVKQSVKPVNQNFSPLHRVCMYIYIYTSRFFTFYLYNSNGYRQIFPSNYPRSPLLPPVYFLFQLQISGIKRVFIDEFFTFHRDLISEGTRYTFPFFPSLAIPSIDVTVCPANIRCCPTIFFFFYLSISFHLHPDEIIT